MGVKIPPGYYDSISSRVSLCRSLPIISATDISTSQCIPHSACSMARCIG